MNAGDAPPRSGGASPKDRAVAAAASPVLRETAISMAFSGVMSAVFVLVLFGSGRPIDTWSFALDFLPQATIIGLVASLMPRLAVMRRLRVTLTWRRQLGKVAVSTATGAAIGCVAFILAQRCLPPSIDPGPALWAKAVFGMGIALVVTPRAVIDVMKTPDTTRSGA